MAKGLLINLDRCTGCDSCIVACKLENRLPLGSFYNKVIAIGPTGTFPMSRSTGCPRSASSARTLSAWQCVPRARATVIPRRAMCLSTRTSALAASTVCTAAPMACVRWTRSTAWPRSARCARRSPPWQRCARLRAQCNCGARFFGDYDDPDSDVCREMAKYPEECIHALPDPGNAKPLTRYILSPKFASWKELI